MVISGVEQKLPYFLPATTSITIRPIDDGIRCLKAVFTAVEPPILLTFNYINTIRPIDDRIRCLKAVFTAVEPTILLTFNYIKHNQTNLGRNQNLPYFLPLTTSITIRPIDDGIRCLKAVFTAVEPPILLTFNYINTIRPIDDGIRCLKAVFTAAEPPILLTFNYISTIRPIEDAINVTEILM
ncbi:Hypothetical predicted protein [Mytilus galloprovincialis]|uniref:Uncharacterized protein n=1 Tax=Mytilus galloprovincialis TaxID=29158 RepID=A0A8B6C6N3_MYTGA|nr:Hypothetical predicted protein [Mytilus galloprovincialis]